MYKVKEMIFISPLRKTLTRYSVYVLLVTITLVFFSIPHYLIAHSQQILVKERARFKTDLKYILFWKPSKGSKFGFYYPKEQEMLAGQKVFINQKCKFINCYVTYNKDLLREDHRNFDAVVFSVHDVVNLVPRDINLTRSPFQKYIFHSLESAAKFPVCDPGFDGFFNWTWTYKLDSDIVHPFFNIYDAQNKLVGPKKEMNWISKMTHNDRYTNKVSQKKKAVALVIAKCSLKTQYMEYIKDLQEELRGYNYSLDIFGPCGDQKCPENHILNCYKLVEKKYFFHLILEDLIADDYVTDGIVKAMTYLAIPIVLGGHNYTSFLPPASFINSEQFNMKKLGAIIDYLIKNPKTYEYFFDWKNHYYYTPKSRSNLCELCIKLNSNDSASIHENYEHFRNWWNPVYRHKCRKLRYDQLLVSGE